MRIAFLHFHLKTGGVTSVIARQVEAVKHFGGQAVIVSGESAVRPMGCDVIVIPQLGYDRSGIEPDPPESIAREIDQALLRYWPAGADLLHVHNPTLAKNRGLQGILKVLQHCGASLLCQVHDFAEDGRPAFYFDEPYVADCHYAVLNGRDYRLLRQAGLEERGLHLLANPVVPLCCSYSASQSTAGDVLYPVRAIRRKNIGEALLVSCFFDPPAMLSVTLPPNSQADRISYDRWRRFAAGLDLPVRFEAGVHEDFHDLMSRCRFVLTTSISEGFGYVFMESWTAGKSLWGRLLPDISADFIQNGLRLDHLYKQLNVPLELFDYEGFGRRWQSARTSAALRFGIELTSSENDAEWHAVVRGAVIDFGLLDEIGQQQVVARIIESGEDRKRLIRMNPFLQRPGPPPGTSAVIAHNQAVVAQRYSPAQYADRLQAVYRGIVDGTPPHHAIDKGILARAFQAPYSFGLLKWGDIDA